MCKGLRGIEGDGSYQKICVELSRCCSVDA
jgi:hypothetical protein